MYSCSTCGRGYASRSSLTRHERNHQQHDGFTCETCQVRFRRHDLLLRHHLIHESRQQPVRRRQRCHTACDRCRARRAKCDGSRPCAACAAERLPCRYDSPSTRISAPTAQSLGSAATAPSAGGGNDHADYGTEAQSTTILSPGPLAEHATQLGIPGLSPAAPPVPFDLTSSQLHPVDGASNSIMGDFDSFWSLPMPWQWAHEDLYFQNNTFPSLSVDVAGGFPAACTQPYGSGEGRETPRAPANADGRSNGRLGGDTITSADMDDMHPGNVLDSAADLDEIVTRMTMAANARDKHIDWGDWSSRVASVIEPPAPEAPNDEGKNFLHRLVDRFYIHFHPLWPLVPSKNPASPDIRPVLFLTMSSIGALYSGATAAAEYGSLMHNRLRTTLLDCKSPSDQTENEALDFGRAMLLTQVAALYFEQDGAFSAAEQLGARLYAYAHRMQLFSCEASSAHGQYRLDAEVDGLAEGRRMLAFGILRAETYMSVLFNRKPMLSYEEINLPLPRAREAYCAASTPNSVQGQLTQPTGTLLFSDLVRLVLDGEEALPSLRPVDLELLMFGLQGEVWRFCHDPQIFPRLTRQPRPHVDSQLSANGVDLSDLPTADFLDQTGRKMTRLVGDYQSMLKALRKWQNGTSQAQLQYPVEGHRSEYLSGIILLEVGLLRLCAPADAILQVAYQTTGSGNIERKCHENVADWTASLEVTSAISHARNIWRILDAETSRAGKSQAKYNILALISLHIAAVVVWTIAGSNRVPEECFLGSKTAPEFMLRRDNTRTLMRGFDELSRKVSISWGMQSSFSRIVEQLAERPFLLPSM